ncbi:MAG: response regulator [Polyangiaceae bacterium]|jgi:CheY-like chemotaxis protein|nr:response regulator [Polyangiaceae bacterium]
MAKLLLVEDEATLRASVARGLSRLPGIEVDAVGSVGDALASIDRRAPDMILSDIDLPDRSGIELLGELARRGLRCPVVFVSAYLRAYGPQIPPNAGVDVLEKPVSLDTLREVVQQKLRSAPADAPFAVVDYIQLACMGHRSVRIEFRGERFVGSICVKDGTLWTAEDQRGSGVPAFHRLAFRRDGHVDCTTLRDDPGPRTIHEPWESLLIDAARLLDEANYNGVSLDDALQLAPPLDEPATPTLPSETLVEPPPSPDEARFALVWDRGLQALLARRYQEALLAFLEAREICPQDGKVLANIACLEAMGYHANPQGEAP